ELKLKEIIQSVMGHTPINLGNPEHISWVLHSVKVNDKNLWKETFNLGSEERNGVSKKKYTKKYSPEAFRDILRKQCSSLYRTVASQCKECGGTGRIQKYNKDGSPSKRLNICHTCSKTGIIYTNTPVRAGFRIPPISSEYT